MNDFVKEHPLASVGTALVLGYTVGGGLTARATRWLLWKGLRLGVQLALLPALEREVVGLAGTLGERLAGESSDHDGHRHHQEA